MIKGIIYIIINMNKKLKYDLGEKGFDRKNIFVNIPNILFL